MNRTTIIAIDGPSASGKGTIARKLAAHYGFAYLDTGLLYRAVGVAVMRSGGDLADAATAEKAALALAGAPIGFAGIDFVQLMQDTFLRSDDAGTAASKVAAFPGVRTALLHYQKDYCATPPDGKKGAVLDGRDIGTIIAPHANVKIFVTASAEARAIRRFKELQGRGVGTSYEAVLSDMKTRDARDAERAIAPTKPALDAVLLDTTPMDAEQALAAAIKIVDGRMTA